MCLRLYLLRTLCDTQECSRKASGVTEADMRVVCNAGQNVWANKRLQRIFLGQVIVCLCALIIEKF